MVVGFRQVKDGRRRRMWVVDDAADRAGQRRLFAEPIWAAAVVVVVVGALSAAGLFVVLTILGHAAVSVRSSVASCPEISPFSLDGQDNDRRFLMPFWPPPVPSATNRRPVFDTVVPYGVFDRLGLSSASLPSVLPSVEPARSPWRLFPPLSICYYFSI